ARAYVCLMYYNDSTDAWADSGFSIVAVDLTAGTAMFAMQHCSTFAVGLATTIWGGRHPAILLLLETDFEI
ncbi:MAG TPA: hypothetical protein VKK79_01265, partial [Candidatus Lokiarchaeia archaeon]|nr:hypothetical protein [Candidatus Lokiarchaeia archaeon]